MQLGRSHKRNDKCAREKAETRRRVRFVLYPRLYVSAQECMATIMNFPIPREHVLTSGNTTIGVIPELSLVSHFQVGPWQVLYRPIETGNIERWGLPLMIPNFSRLKNGMFKEKGTILPIHGFGRSLPWTVIEQDSSRISIQLISNAETRRNYPYDFTFTATMVASE